jgi:hypothetical protein
MKIVLWNLNIDQVNEYFHFYDTYVDYAERVRVLDMNYGLPLPPYEDFISESKIWCINKAKELHVDIDLIKFKELLRKNKLEKNQDEILFATAIFKDCIYNPNSDFPSRETDRLQNLEYFQMLKYIILYRHIKGKSTIEIKYQKDKSSSVSIKDPDTIFDFLGMTMEFILDKLKWWDPETETFMTADKITLGWVESHLNFYKKGTPGPKPTGRKHLAKFSYQLLHFLNSETRMKKGPHNLISDLQARFIFDLFVVFSLIDDLKIGSPPAKYITSLVKSVIPEGT